MPSFSCTVQETVPAGLRLDRYAAEYLKILSRSQVKARGLHAVINGKAVKVSRLLKGGERLELSWDEAEAVFLEPENLPLEVLYEDERVIVINKAQGMVVHPGAGNRRGTLANALLYRRLEQHKQHAADCAPPLAADAAPNTASLRPGIVHRLDKDTSGVIIAAWDERALAFLADQFKARSVRKTYAALVRGCPRELSGSIDKKIVRSRSNRKIFTVSDTEGRASFTSYKVIRAWGGYSLLLLRPKTGRTHQIRVHLKHLGHPVLGDPLYGHSDPRFKKAPLMLHAKSLSLMLPDRLPGQENPVTFTSPLPDRFRAIIRALNKGKPL
ncbi:MAG: RluA family pseudouridine synthase [Treponema sp.]|nr:RluA family pseudouridine synthase [Treponema sp.]